MRRVALIHEADGHLFVLVEEGEGLEVLLVDEADPPETRLQVLGERVSREEIDDALATSIAREHKPNGSSPAKKKNRAQGVPAAAAVMSAEARAVELALDETWTREPLLSDHARLRWLQRVKGWDVGIADREILTKKNRAAIRAGVSALHIAGWRLPVAPDGRIKTVIPREPKRKLDKQWLIGRPEPKRDSGRKKTMYETGE